MWIRLMERNGIDYSLLNLSTVSVIHKDDDHNCIAFTINESFTVRSYGRNEDFKLLQEKLLGN